MTISADHVRALLSAAPDAQLVVTAGRAEVRGPGELTGGELAVLSHAELQARLEGHEPSAEMLDELAARLDTAVGTMGG
jgi:hypothetical protein